MNEDKIHEKSEQIRSVIRYVKRFKNALIVIYIDDEIIESPLFSSHIKDISLIHEAGLNVVIVPGARKTIDKVLSQSNISWSIQNGCRITTPDAMPLIKTAAFDTSNTVMTSLAGEHLTAVIGNWVRSRGKGVINGIDYGTSGEIDKLEIESIRGVLEKGFIPIFPCIGWSLTGKPYNISSLQLAEQIAVYLHADKLFFLVPQAEISKENFIIPPEIGISPDGCVPALSIEELSNFLKINSDSPSPNKDKIIPLLNLAQKACTEGVRRTHIINGSLDGSIPREIFSDLGSGTMIHSNSYGNIRNMKNEDIPGVLRLIRPYVTKGILLPRTDKQLLSQIDDFIVYELDGGIRSCAALHLYENNQAEIAALAVDETCSHIGIGPLMINHLIQRAKNLNLKSVFVLTTQTADWFENIGFIPDSIQTLPLKRKNEWTPNRNSKLFRKMLNK